MTMTILLTMTMTMTLTLTKIISTTLLPSLLTLITFLVITNARHITSATAALNLKLSCIDCGPIWLFWYIVSNAYFLYLLLNVLWFIYGLLL